jgi:hypothetical protein
VSDELEPVEQKFIADLADYAEPVQDAADETEEFADAVRQAEDALDGIRDKAAEAGESLADMSGSEDELAASLADTNHELHDQTESFFALAAARDAANASGDEFAAMMDKNASNSRSLMGALQELRDLAADADIGDFFGIGQTGPGTFSVVTGQESAAIRDLAFSELKFRDAMLEADEESIKASADMDAYRDSLRSLLAAVKDMEYGTEDFSKALAEDGSGGGGGGGGIFALIARMFGGGGPEGGLGAILGNLGAMGAGGAIGVGLVALIQEIGLVITGFVAALDGVASFALFAVPSIEKVFKALHDTRAELAKMPPDERDAVKGIQDLEKEYDRLSRAFAPDVFRTFDLGLKGAFDLLKSFKPFADTAATSIDGLLRQFDKFLNPVQPGFSKPGVMGGMPQPSQFQQWMDAFQKISGPAITAIGKGIGDVASNLGKLMTALPPQDVVNAINIFFRVISGAITGIDFLVKLNARRWDEYSQAFRNWGNAWVHVFGIVEHAFDNFNHACGNIMNVVFKTVDTTRRDFDGMNDAIRRDFGDAVSFIQSAGGRMQSFLLSVISQIVSRWDSGWNQVVSFTGRIPGLMLQSLGDIGDLLIADGEHLIDGLISGIEHAIPGLESIISFVSGLVSKVEGLLGDAGTTHSGNVSGSTGRFSGTSASVSHSVTVHVAAMAGPAYTQGVSAAVRSAVLDFAQANGTSMLVLPGRRS